MGVFDHLTREHEQLHMSARFYTRDRMYELPYVRRSKRVTDAEMLMLQLSEDRYQDILRKCTSKVISAERQVSTTALCVRLFIYHALFMQTVCHV